MSSKDYSSNKEASDERKKRVLFLVWAPHSERALGIAEKLGAKVYFMHYGFKSKIYSPLKYPYLFLRSALLLGRSRPDVVLCQSPPIFCPLAGLVYIFLINRRAKLIVDAHTAALGGVWSYLKHITKPILKRASCVLVTNEGARNRLAFDYGIEPAVLEDKIPSFGPVQSDHANEQTSSADLKIVIPSSFASDEPIHEILSAATALPGVKLFLTGDSSKVSNSRTMPRPKNVVFTGFLKRAEYLSLLSGCDAVMALTTRDWTMLAGAYDAAAFEKPLITSDWAPLKRYFDKGTLHVDNSAAAIVDAINIVMHNKKELANGMRALKVEKSEQWERSFKVLLSIIYPDNR